MVSDESRIRRWKKGFPPARKLRYSPAIAAPVTRQPAMDLAFQTAKIDVWFVDTSGQICK